MPRFIIWILLLLFLVMPPARFVCTTKLRSGQLCNRGFQNRSGLTQHIHSQHRKWASPPRNISPNRSPSPVLSELGFTDGDFVLEETPPAEFDDEHGMNKEHEAGERTRILKHPILDGI